MKKEITIFIITSMLALSCSTSKTVSSNGNYENCLPKSFGIDLNLLMKSFEEFVYRNYDGQTELFISSILNRKFPNKNDFNKSDFEIADRLRTNNFRNFIYTEYEEKLSDSGLEIAPPRTANQNEEESRMMIKVDINKPYLNCLSSTPSNGELIKEYVDLQKSNPSLNPLIVGDLFLRNKSDVDYKTKMANAILAVELYYMILDSATKQ